MTVIDDAKLRIFWSEFYQQERNCPLPKSLGIQITYCMYQPSNAGTNSIRAKQRAAFDFTRMDKQEEEFVCTRAGKQIGNPALLINHVDAPSTPCLIELYQKCSI
jgi:hypothetical protein